MSLVFTAVFYTKSVAVFCFRFSTLSFNLVCLNLANFF